MLGLKLRKLHYLGHFSKRNSQSSQISYPYIFTYPWNKYVLELFYTNFSTPTGQLFFLLISMNCTVLGVNVQYFQTSVPGKVDCMLAGLEGAGP